jgi:uncharacterized protein (TIGR00369 family)
MIKTHNPDFRNTIQEKLVSQTFMDFIGFRVTNVAEGKIEGELDLQDYHKQNKGFVHGGVTAILADTVAGLAAVTLVPKGSHVVTVELKVSYLNPGLGGKLTAKGWVLRQGNLLNFCEAEVFSIKDDAEPILIAKASATMATIKPED